MSEVNAETAAPAKVGVIAGAAKNIVKKAGVVAKKLTKDAAKKAPAKKANSKDKPSKVVAKTASKDKAGKPVKRGVGALARELITKGKSTEEVIAAVKKEFPESSISAGSVAWYRNDIKAMK